MKRRSTPEKLKDGVTTSYKYGLTEFGKTAYIHFISKHELIWWSPVKKPAYITMTTFNPES